MGLNNYQGNAVEVSGAKILYYIIYFDANFRI